MEKAITTALLIITGVICMIFVFNSVYPMINRSSHAMVSMADTIDERMKSRVNIVHATNSSDRRTIYIWVKNVGTSRIVDVESTDVFFGLETNFARIPHESDAGGVYPQWAYTIENDTEWKASATVKITITYTVAPSSGTYYIKVIIPNGIEDEYYFSM
ncbi:MAG: hypothetical protein PHR56_00620 [Dehalococcoidales bacterium]|nr:hypothetical protein [Dehalococcoidales bacterium]